MLSCSEVRFSFRWHIHYSIKGCFFAFCLVLFCFVLFFFGGGGGRAGDVAFIKVVIRKRKFWAALHVAVRPQPSNSPVSMSDDLFEWFLAGLNGKFLVSLVVLFQLFSLKGISDQLLLMLKTVGRIELHLPLKWRSWNRKSKGRSWECLDGSMRYGANDRWGGSF